MTVRSKALLILGLTAIGMVLAVAALSRLILLKAFSDLGADFAREDVRRVVRAVNRELQDMNSVNWDWAGWDDTCAFMAQSNEAYTAANLVDSTFKSLRLNAIIFLRNDGSVAWGRAVDLSTHEPEPEPMPLPREFLAQFRQPCRLRAHDHPLSAVMGLVRFGGVPMLITSRPIVTSEDEGPIQGVLLMGRLLDSAAAERLALLTGMRVTAHEPASPALPSDIRAPHAALPGWAPILVRPEGESRLAGYAMLRDVNGAPCVILETEQPRLIYRAAESAVSYFLFALVVCVLLVGGTGLLILEQHVLRRLAGLGQQVARMRAAGDIESRLPAVGRDEVSLLANEFNRLLDSVGRLMAEQRALQGELEHRVEERTRALAKAEDELRRLYRHVEDVREVERRASAERVHDELGQLATAVRMGLERLQVHLPATDAKGISQLEGVIGIIDNLTRTIQDIAMDLRPPILDHLGLAAAIEWAARRFHENSGLRCDVDLEDIHIPDRSESSMLFRIVQELLTNVGRHARATRVDVRLLRDGDLLRLEVEDNGRGMRQEDAHGASAFGLSAVRQRVAALGGTMEIGLGIPKGTRVSIVVPLVPESDQKGG